MQGKMTLEQVRQRSRDFHAAADDIRAFHLANFNRLTENEHNRLHRCEDDLRTQARQLLADAGAIIWQDLQEALNNIREGTDKMRSVRRHLKSVQRAIAFTAKAIGLGASILTGNILGVATASLEMVNLVNEFRDEDDQAERDEEDVINA